VLLHIGINDLDRSTDKEHAADRLVLLLDQIYTDQPGVTVLLLGLIPTTGGLQDLVAAFNDKAKALEPTELAAGRKFRYIDPPALTTEEMADRLHPNEAGYARMAQAFQPAIDQAFTDGWVVGGPPETWNGVAETKSRVRFADFTGDGRDDYVGVND